MASFSDELFERKTDKIKGRHLQCSQNIKAGTLIFTERPLASMQSLANVQHCQICRECKCYVGDVDSALNHVLSSSSLTNPTPSPNTSAPSTTPPVNLYPCRKKCGFLFCSKACETKAYESTGHCYLCTGDITAQSADDHPLIKYKIHAMKSNEIFLVVGEIVSNIVASLVNKNRTLQQCIQPYADFTNVLWWDVATKPMMNDLKNGGFVKAMELEKALKCICDESSQLLKQHFGRDVLQGQLKGSADVLFTRDFFGSVIGTFEQNAIGVRLASPIFESLTDGGDYGMEERLRLHALIVKVVGESEEEGEGDACVDEDCEDVECVNADVDVDVDVDDIDLGKMDVNEEAEEGGEDEEKEFTPLDVTKLLIKSSITSSTPTDFDQIFPQLDGTALFSTACKMNHSCTPNVFVQYSGGFGSKRPLVLEVIAICDVKAGEELCISYIDDSTLDYKVRKGELENYGFLCGCERCRIESMETTEESDDMDDEVDDDMDDEEDDDDDMIESLSERDANALLIKRLGSKTHIPTSVLSAMTSTSSLQFTFIPPTIYANTIDFVRQGLMIFIQQNSQRALEVELIQLLMKYLREILTGSETNDTRSIKTNAKLSIDLIDAYIKVDDSNHHPEFLRGIYQVCLVALSLTSANESRFIEGMESLEEAVSSGLAIESISGLFKYIERHAASSR